MFDDNEGYNILNILAIESEMVTLGLDFHLASPKDMKIQPSGDHLTFYIQKAKDLIYLGLDLNNVI